MLASFLPHSSIDTYPVTSSLRCKALFIVINLILLLYNVSAFIPFKNGPKYLTGIYPFDEIPTAEFSFKKLSRSSEVIFILFPARPFT